MIFSVEEFTLPKIHSWVNEEEIYAKYGKEFFKENFLIVYEVDSGSGTPIPKVADVKIVKGETITITRRWVSYSDICDCEMVSWIILVPISRTNADGTEKIVLS